MKTNDLLERLAAVELPAPDVVSASPDRLRFFATPEFNARLQELVAAGVFEKWPRSLTTPTHGRTALESYRQARMRDSLQIIPHTTGEIEVDCDAWNPNWGVFPAAMHLGGMIGGWFRRLA